MDLSEIIPRYTRAIGKTTIVISTSTIMTISAGVKNPFAKAEFGTKKKLTTTIRIIICL